jgi:ferric-dicitrate binding protein FerR (iron transport regulator)
MAASEKVTDLRLQQAVRSFTLRQSGAWTRDDEAKLEIWLAADPENRAAYEKVGRAWTVTGQAAGRVSRELPPRRPYGLWIAASLLAALSYPLWVMSDNWWNGPRAEWSAVTRYHLVSFVFKDPELRDLRVSGTFRTDNLPLFLRTLRAALPIETVWLDAQRVEISRRTGIGPRESFASKP